MWPRVRYENINKHICRNAICTVRTRLIFRCCSSIHSSALESPVNVHVSFQSRGSSSRSKLRCWTFLTTFSSKNLLFDISRMYQGLFKKKKSFLLRLMCGKSMKWERLHALGGVSEDLWYVTLWRIVAVSTFRSIIVPSSSGFSSRRTNFFSGVDLSSCPYVSS